MKNIYSYAVKGNEGIVGCDSILCEDEDKAYTYANELLTVFIGAVSVEMFKYEQGKSCVDRQRV